ncbi:MAG: glycosyltransferase family 4 protein [Adhaeribacter sp.]
MKVTFFHRRPAASHFSIENLFHQIISHLPPDVEATASLSRYVNSGIYSKLYNLFEILFKPQGEINHVTGDIHYITCFLQKKKTILTIHDLNLLYTSNKLKRFLHKWFWIRMPVKRSRFITVISATTKAELLKYTRCDPDKIKVIYNCISPAFRPHPKIFDKERPTILHIGCKPNKNLTRVIEAVKGLACRLEIIGSPSAEQLALLGQYQVDYRAQAGLSEQEVIQKYIACDILVFVSLFEGFGLPIIEANAIERVVVTSNISAMPEIAADAACLVDPFNPAAIRQGLLQVIENDRFREALIQNGRRNKTRFTPGLIAGQYYALYQQMLAQPRTPPRSPSPPAPEGRLRNCLSTKK